jgi:RNA polymerase sigma factor (sigma-70 family)
MDATTNASELASLLEGPVADQLRARGVALEEVTGEEPRCRRNRLETALMVLVRDTEDPAVFEALHALSHRHLLVWVRARILPGCRPLDAREILQDTFINIFCYRRSFRDDDGRVFGAWARTIAANAVRASARQPARFSYHALPEGLQEPTDPRALPDQIAVMKEEALHLRRTMGLFLLHYRRAWNLLKERDRQVLEWVECDGRSYAELAGMMEVSPSNIKMIVFRARLRLRVEMHRAMG